MTVLIESKDGRCDARCYNGKEETRCVCVCQGKNHARGLLGALENTRDEALPDDCEDFATSLLSMMRSRDNHYIVFKRLGERSTVGDCKILHTTSGQRPIEIRHVEKHSPTGMNFGYGGSGPADAALSILTYLYGPAAARDHYQDFKWKFVAPVDQEQGGTVKISEIDAWMKDRIQEVGHAK